jgi:putative isomerase
MMPKLEKYHAWWYNDRDQNKNGLCEYGSTDGTRIAAAWESGMDNAVRFDEATLFKNNDGAWSLDQESVDLNAYLFAEKQYLAAMASILGDSDKQQKYLSEAAELKTAIQERFYNREQGYFFDYHITNEAPVEVIGPEAWTALWAGIATDVQAEHVRDVIMDTLHFNTTVPFPTLSYSHPEFNPRRGYWRGPVWIDQAWFALEGLKRYGYEKEYRQMKTKLLHNAEGMLEPGIPLRENYHPETGEGLNAKHFSWTAAHLLLLL